MRFGWRSQVVGLALVAVSTSGCVFITRSSVSSSEAQADDLSEFPSTSGDGRYVAFQSNASNLVPGDTNGVTDVFVRDHQTGDTERVSVATGGAEADIGGSGAAISGDGRYVAFESQATNLVAGDTNGIVDIFVHDRDTDTTQRVSVATGGTQASGGTGIIGSVQTSISGDGRYVAFSSDATNLVSGDLNEVDDVFVHDRTTGTTQRVSVDSTGAEANNGSFEPSLSGDGRYVAFGSFAADLVTGDTNNNLDEFVHDRTTGATQRVSVATGGAQANGDSSGSSISGDGRHVAFSSDATNLVAGDTNGATDGFVHDRTTGATERVSVATGGAQADFGGGSVSISGDGRYVAFASQATNLVAGDTNDALDVFVRDRTNGWTQRASLAVFYQQANGNSGTGGGPSISGDGRYVAFESIATNLVDNDTNGEGEAGGQDIFLKFALAPRPLAAVGSTSIARGTTGQITITGSWFDPNFLKVVVGPFEGTTVDQVSVQNPNTTAVVTITVASDAETGSRDLYVTNPGNAWNVNAVGSDVCNDCLTIT
jgi:Tol biopolymer transport system component